MMAKRPITILLLAATLCVNVLLTALRPSETLGVVLIAMLFAELGLLAMWAVLGRGWSGPRWLAAAVAVPVFSIACAWINARTVEWNEFYLFLHVFILHVLLVAGTAGGLTLLLPNRWQHTQRGDRKRPQFLLKHILLVMTGTTIFFFSFREVRDEAEEEFFVWIMVIAISFFAAFSALVCLALIHSRHLRFAAVVAVGIVVFLVINPILGIGDELLSTFGFIQALIYATWLSIVSYDQRQAYGVES